MIELSKAVLAMLAEGAAKDWIGKEGRSLGVNLSSITRVELVALNDEGWYSGRPNGRGTKRLGGSWWPPGAWFRLHWQNSCKQERSILWWVSQRWTDLKAFDF